MTKRTDASKQFSATNLRVVLSLVLLVILGLMAGGFYLAYQALHPIALEVSKAQTEASESDTRLQQLSALHDRLAEYRSTIDKASQIVAESKEYQYQNQIIDDLTHYAATSGVGIQSFAFEAGGGGASSQTGANSSPSSSTGASAPSSTDNPSPSPTPVASSLKSVNVVIQLTGDIPYNNLLHFVSLIENNITRMQIANLLISKSSGEGASDLVSVQSLTIEVYIK